jgi:hypothetical protein
MTEQRVMKASHMGSLEIGGVSVPCAVLEEESPEDPDDDPLRVFDYDVLLGLVGFSSQSELTACIRRYISREIPDFLVTTLAEPIQFTGSAGEIRKGLPCEIPALLYGLLSDADGAGLLTIKLQRVARRLAELMQGFAAAGLRASFEHDHAEERDCGYRWPTAFSGSSTAGKKKRKTRDCSRGGWIYFIQWGDGGPIKIGFSDRPDERLAALSTGSPVPLRLLGQMRGNRGLEQALHRKFEEDRVRREWFHPSGALLQYVATVSIP